MNALLKKVFFVTLLMAAVMTAGLAQAKALDAGTVYLEPKVGFYGNSNSHISSMFTYGGELGYFVIPDLSIGAEVLGYSIDQKRHSFSETNGNNVGGIGVSGILRYHFVDTQTLSMFGGIGLGALFADAKLPYNGSESLFSQLAEVGLNVFLADPVSLQVAGRWQHYGEYSSKGLNSWGGNVAIKFVF